MKRGLNGSVKGEGPEEKPYFEAEVLTERQDLIKKLNGICNQLLRRGG